MGFSSPIITLQGHPIQHPTCQKKPFSLETLAEKNWGKRMWKRHITYLPTIEKMQMEIWTFDLAFPGKSSCL